ncbi:hypothetical protein L9F63_008125, partial [Diploptera punctata]
RQVTFKVRILLPIFTYIIFLNDIQCVRIETNASSSPKRSLLQRIANISNTRDRYPLNQSSVYPHEPRRHTLHSSFNSHLKE